MKRPIVLLAATMMSVAPAIALAQPAPGSHEACFTEPEGLAAALLNA